MFEYFYHEILRRTIISFGTLFNGIEIQHDDSDDNVVSTIRVPLAYGPTQKFLARLQQSPDLNKPTSITLPRMSFEFTGLQYDGSRKVTTTQTFKSQTVGIATAIRKTYMPVPYNMSFELSVFTKLNDDMLQIVEQILPYFQPSYNLSVDLGADGNMIQVNDASGIAENTYIIINNESMYVDKKDATDTNKLFVKRGEDRTTPTAHVAGAGVNLITATTNSLIEIGDDFGFDGSFD